MRLHMQGYMKLENNLWNIGGVMFLLFIDILSIILIAHISTKLRFLSRAEWFFLTDCNKPLSLITGIMAFVFFKKLQLPYIPLVNIMGGSTFGILLIHADNDTMRKWLWHDFLHNVDMYDSPWLVSHAVGCVIAIFIVCIVIDQLRLRFIEPPTMVLFDRCWPCMVGRFKRLEAWFARKCAGFTGE